MCSFCFETLHQESDDARAEQLLKDGCLSACYSCRGGELPCFCHCHLETEAEQDAEFNALVEAERSGDEPWDFNPNEQEYDSRA